MIKANILFIVLIILYLITGSQADQSNTGISQALMNQLGIGSTGEYNGGYVNPGTNAGGNFASENEYFKIKRNTTINYKGFISTNKPNFVEVTIQGCGRTFSNILIKESIDPDLGNFKNLSFFKENPFTSTHYEIKKYEYPVSDIGESFNNMSDNYYIKNNTMYAKVSFLNSGENVKYIYEIESKKPGIFDVLTQVRLNGSIHQDLERQDQIEIRPPELQVETQCGQSFAEKDTPLNITYCILYKQGWCKEPIIFSMKFNQSNNYEILFVNNLPYHYEYFNQTLDPLITTKFPIKIQYKDAGMYSAPPLDIKGVTVSQNAVQIDVKESYLIKKLRR